MSPPTEARLCISMAKVVFLDRDGLINQKAPEHDYIKRWENFKFLHGVLEAVKKLNAAGYLTVIVTNQRGVACGMMTMDVLDAIHRNMCAAFAENGGEISGVYVCPHEQGACSCRKPDIGLFLQAEHDFEIDKVQSWMVGDSNSDVEAGRRYGVRTIKTKSLAKAVERILEESQ